MAEIFLFVLKCFYLMLPAYFANMAPVMFRNLRFMKYPVDFNRYLWKNPIFGKNKTFRGLIFGILMSIIVVYVQHELHIMPYFESISFFDYNNWLRFGVLMGLGALLGDLTKSFFKRRLGIKPGDAFIPFDQTDFVIGALVFVMPVFKVSIPIFLVSLTLSFILHIIVNHTAFYLGIRNEKW